MVARVDLIFQESCDLMTGGNPRAPGNYFYPGRKYLYQRQRQLFEIRRASRVGHDHHGQVRREFYAVGFNGHRFRLG